MHDGTSLRPEPVILSEPGTPPPTTVVGRETAWLGARHVGLGTRQQIQDELDDIAAAVRAFHTQQPDQVMKQVAAYGARLTELCVLLHRVESLDRQYTRVRTQQVERWLAELDRQFKVASRLVEVQRQDLALLGGMS